MPCPGGPIIDSSIHVIVKGGTINHYSLTLGRNWDGWGQLGQPSCPPWLLCFLGLETTFSYKIRIYKNCCFQSIDWSQKDTYNRVSLLRDLWNSHIYRDGSRNNVTRGWEREWGVSVSGEQGLSLGNEKVLDVDGGDGCPTMWMSFNAPELYTLKWL